MVDADICGFQQINTDYSHKSAKISINQCLIWQNCFMKMNHTK